MALLSLQDVRLSVGGPALFDGVNFNIESGERVCLLGRNGAGKTTLMRLMSGEITADSGEVIFSKGTRRAYLPQDVPPGIEGTVSEVVATGLAPAEAHETHRVSEVLTRLLLDGDADFSTLSGGMKRRVLLARAIVNEPDLLMLDEPTNHLDIESIAWLEDFLKRQSFALLFVTHDRAFLRALSTRIVEVDRGKLFSWECDYNTYLDRKAAALEAESKQNANFDKLLAQEEVWIRKGVKARQTRNEGRVRALQKLRNERSERRNMQGRVRADIQEADRSGHLVVEAKDAAFSYGDKPLIRDFSTRIMRGDKVGFIGPNGSGKTTLLKVLLGQIAPQSGSVKQGTNWQVAYFDQLRAQLDESQTVQWNVAGENDTVLIHGERRHIVGYLQEWLFTPDRIRTPVKVLSGGERNRLLLAKLFTQPANLLVMDEPTNDLDLETLELLENLLVEFSGTLLVVSHDRDFLNNVATSTLSPRGDGTWRDYIGGYDDYARQRAAESTLNAPKTESKPAATTSRPQRERVRKISFNEKRELEGLPAHIEKLEAEHEALVAKVSDPEFYKGDATQTVQVNNRIAEVEAELEAAFARWEELEAIAAAGA
jgi:ATP-binding cassette subfamily F protein uup